MTLAEFFTQTYSLERDITDSTRKFFLLKIVQFTRWLGHHATLDDLTSHTVNRFIAHRITERARETARGERAVLHALWKAAFDAGLKEDRPDRVRVVKRSLKPVEGWDSPEVSRLLAVATNLTGCFRGHDVERAAFWRAVILTLYDSGLRLGDLLAIDAAQLHPPSFTVIQSKTRKPVVVTLSPSTWEEVAAIHPKRRKKPFGDVLCRRYFFDVFAELCDKAGLAGRTKMLRRTSGSLVERLHPGEGHLHLGNTRQVFDQHYHIRRLTDKPPRLPPRLGGVG